ncbi:glutathionylspermidine synthase family protein [Tumebacillus flagellatus]|uniref:Glutathionylspermidine synthase n=1 Tax=Tumebacillus flagellatus TaxID=1157490 RepID=A0A074LV58_9BACL|nr:glutathionylspermidine synthase family protein [Tumebacillus flagellatus]KEO83853.1 glutathionylspermidine synthase [Tumebacillus flagellatus]
MEYAARRDLIYGPLREEGVFTWDWMYGEEYALASFHTISQAQRQELAAATEALGRIFHKVAGIVQQAPDELLLQLGIPEAALGAVRVTVADDVTTLVGRFDFASTSQGLKMLEFNSDTPTSIVEAFHVNGRVCEHFGVEDPNRGMVQHLRDGFGRLLARYAELGYPVEEVYFSALDWHDEDAGTTKYLLEQSGLRGQFIPLADLRYYDDQLAAYKTFGDEWELHRIDVLYRLHALEKLAEECDEEGFPTGARVLDLIARRKLAVINPPQGFIAQTKALQALIWNLHETGEFFTEQEHEAIARYMLPTYLENRFLGESEYVTKPIFGREGGGVVLWTRDGQAEEQDQEAHYWEQPMIYQQRVELESISVETLRGTYDGHLLWGSFLIDGQASAIVARVGGKITGNLSYYLPVGVTQPD